MDLVSCKVDEGAHFPGMYIINLDELSDDMNVYGYCILYHLVVQLTFGGP